MWGGFVVEQRGGDTSSSSSSVMFSHQPVLQEIRIKTKRQLNMMIIHRERNNKVALVWIRSVVQDVKCSPALSWYLSPAVWMENILEIPDYNFIFPDVLQVIKILLYKKVIAVKKKKKRELIRMTDGEMERKYRWSVIHFISYRTFHSLFNTPGMSG